MKINNYDNQTNFGIKLQTTHALEATSGIIFDSTGTDGFKAVITALNTRPMKGIGNRGYRYYAKQLGEQICAKYPEIANVTQKLQEIKANNPNLSEEEFANQVKPYIAKLGTQVDITL